MPCIQDGLGDSRKFFDRFYLKVNQQRVPVTGALELTARCNLKCVHCYMPRTKGLRTDPDSELSCRRWRDIIDQITDAGCLFLLITGGEAMLRDDFKTIYRYACRKGLLVTVFTNGTRISEAVLDAFDKYPPHSVEVSLYGATAATYQRITGLTGSFEKCMQGMTRLADRGIPLKLKTMLMRENIAELADMEKLAADFGASFRFDPVIFPRLDGDADPVNFRVMPEQAVAKEFETPHRAQQQHDFYFRMAKAKTGSGLYVCGAGLNMFYISASGRMRPCVMACGTEADLADATFMDAWHSAPFQHLRTAEKAPEACRDCDRKSLCGYCPGLFSLESGGKGGASPFACELGRLRKAAVLNFHEKEKAHDHPTP